MLEKFFSIRHSERKSILFFFLLSFTWSIAVSFGVAFSDALLLKHVGAECFPLAFVITASGMLLVSGLFIYLYNRKEVSQIFKSWIYLALAFYLISFSCISLNICSSFFYIAFKALSYIIQIGFYSCFWSFVDQYFELQNAKRLFGIFYSAIFLGTAVSGSILALIPNLKNNPGVFSIILFSLMISLYLIFYIQKKLIKLPDDHLEFAVIKTHLSELIKTIANSPFTLLFLSFCVILQMLLVITEYQYMFGLQKFFDSNSEADLTQFLGKLYLFGAGFNIFFGIFLYGRLIKKAGLNNVILILPIFFTSLFCGWGFSNHLIFSIMGFIAVEGVLTLVEDNNFTLLLNAVPLKLKNKIRIICESLVEPIGILLSSFSLIFLQQKSKMLGLILSLFFLVVALLLRAYYTKGIFYNLISHLIPFTPEERKLKNKLSPKDYHQSKPAFIHQFLSLKPKEQFFLIECALKFNDLEFLNTLLEKITKLSDSLKIKVLDTFCDYPQAITDNFLPLMHTWAKKSSLIKNHLIFHKAKMGLIEIGDNDLKGDHLYQNASKYLLQLKENPTSPIALEGLKKMLSSSVDSEITVAIEAIRFIEEHPLTSKLIELLISKPHLKEPLLKTLSYSLSPLDAPFLPTFLEELDSENDISHRALYLTCIKKLLTPQNLETIFLHSTHWKILERKSLVSAALDIEEPIASILISILENKKYPDKVRLLAGQILAKVDKKHLKSSYEKLFEEEMKKAYLYYYHYITIQKSYPYTSLELLELSLKNSYDSILDFLIQLKAHIQKFDKGEYLAQSLHSSNPKTMSHALETLQKLSSHKHYKKLLPLIETGHEKQFFTTYHKEGLPILSLDGLLDHLEQSASHVNRMIVFSLKNRLNINNGFKVQAFRDSNFELKQEVSLN